MKIAYFDCFSGISGDMSLGALIAAGVPPDDLRSDLERLRLDGWRLDVAAVERNGIQAVDATVTQTVEQSHGRHLHHITEIIDASDLPRVVRRNARAVFERLAAAEAKVHGTTIERIHFHEVGAIDAIVDVVGVCCALQRLGVEAVHASPLPMGHGFVECAHGLIPLPAPAVLELLAGRPVVSVDIEGELVTPTGAALLTGIGARFGGMPAMRLQSVGYGAGKKTFGDRPNLLRVAIGEAVEAPDEADEVVVVETNLDDYSPQFYSLLTERLFAEGALDVYTTPILMKKGRPGTLLTALAPTDKLDRVVERILVETSTLGVRYARMRRTCMERRWVTVDTRYGPVRIKVAERDGCEVNAAPEYEDVAEAARRTGAPLKDVHRAAVVAYAASREEIAPAEP